MRTSDAKIESVCATCRFYLRVEVMPGFGFCRRYPPSFVSEDSEGNMEPRSPMLPYSYWCGEWKLQARLESKQEELKGN